MPMYSSCFSTLSTQHATTVLGVGTTESLYFIFGSLDINFSFNYWLVLMFQYIKKAKSKEELVLNLEPSRR